jgi:hypothetical protein
MERGKLVLLIILIPLSIIQLYASNNPYTWFSWPYGDDVLHFMWGMVIFLFFANFLRWKPTDSLLAVLVWQVFWEVGEMIEEKWSHDTGIFVDNMFFDGIYDTFVDLAGALAGLLILRLVGEPLYERRVARLRYWFATLLISLIPLIVIGSRIALISGSSPNKFSVGYILLAIIVTVLFVRFKPWAQPLIDRRRNKNPAKS